MSRTAVTRVRGASASGRITPTPALKPWKPATIAPSARRATVGNVGLPPRAARRWSMPTNAALMMPGIRPHSHKGSGNRGISRPNTAP